MGQSRYEHLPKTRNWQNVVALLSAPGTSTPRLASAAVNACRGALKRHSDDPYLTLTSLREQAHFVLAAHRYGWAPSDQAREHHPAGIRVSRLPGTPPAVASRY